MQDQALAAIALIRNAPCPWLLNANQLRGAQVVNALPLPALDGGYLALLALEAVRRKKLDQVRAPPRSDRCVQYLCLACLLCSCVHDLV